MVGWCSQFNRIDKFSTDKRYCHGFQFNSYVSNYLGIVLFQLIIAIVKLFIKNHMQIIIICICIVANRRIDIR